MNSYPNAKKLNIVLYNYVHPFEPNSPGGGVSVYLRNLIHTLRAEGHRVYILSAGDRYSLLRRSPHLRRQANDEIFIYNSPVVAPAIYSFHHPEIFLHNHALDNTPLNLQAELGDIDVFHFHNIEGLTLGFFYALRRTFSKSALIFSAHNYNIICPQVNLWQNANISCIDFEEGRACITCSDLPDSRRKKILINIFKTPLKTSPKKNSRLVSAAYFLDRYVVKFFKKSSTLKNMRSTPRPRASAAKAASMASDYVAYRQAGVKLVNEIFDRTLSVSARTASVLAAMGANTSKMSTSYIGTKHMDRMAESKRKYPTKGNLHLCYIGYMRKEKGFFLFLHSLKSIESDIASTIDITIAAKFTDMTAVAEMRNLARKFRTFQMYDGYTQDNLKEILEPVNLGVVPPLWEDNLPQVAIEFVTNGIPILTSNMGGAQEIANDPAFVFKIEEQESLTRKISSIANGDVDVRTFWSNQLQLRSNAQHAKEIIQHYQAAIHECQRASHDQA